MAQKKSKPKQKIVDKDVKSERTPPAPAPAPVPAAGSQPEEQPIPVPEPLPLPVPPPVAKGHATGSISRGEAIQYVADLHTYLFILAEGAADHLVDKQEESDDGDGWGAGDGGDWGDVRKEWGDDKGWGEGVDCEIEGHDNLQEYGDYGNLGWEQTDPTPAHSIDQGQPSRQPVQDHVQTQVPSTPAPSSPSPPLPAPSLSPSAVPVQPVQPLTDFLHDQSESAGHTKVAMPQIKSQNPHLEPKKYIFASSMANRNRSSSQPAISSAPSSRPSYYWDPTQPLPPKQAMSTTKGQHNPPPSNLPPWGQPKNVDPWGDPKPQPIPPPAAPQTAPLAATQKRPAWLDWGRQPQAAASHAPPPADRRTDYAYDYESDDDEYTDDGYTDDDDETHNVWGPSPNANHGWIPHPSKGNSAYQQQPQKHHSHAAPHHHPEKTRRLKEIAEEQRRLAMELEEQKRYKQHYDQGTGRSPKKHKHKSDGRHNDNGWDTMKDEWGTSSGLVNNGGRGQDDNSWGQSGNNGRGHGNEWERDGGNSWGDSGGWGNNGGGDEWNNGGDTWGNNGGNRGGDGWNNGGGDGWNNGGGDGWNNGGGDGWNNGGGDGWGNGGGDGWGNNGGDGWGNNGGDGWGKGNGGQVKGDGKKDKSQGDTWTGHDNSWSNAQGFNNSGASNWDNNGAEGEDWGEKSSTFVHAISPETLKATNSSTSLKLSLPPGTINESSNEAFKPALRAIFGEERLARERIYWIYSPKNDPAVDSILYWIRPMEHYLAFFGLLKFLETKERGALFINVEFRLKEYPDKPVFDWLGYKQVRKSADRILQQSILVTDPAEETVVFVYLLSRTGNSVAMWRRKLHVTKDIRQKYLKALKKVKAGLRPDEDIWDDELPPSDKGKQSKNTKKSMQATKAEPAKLNKDPVSRKLTKPALKTHQHGQSLPTVAQKKRKWWQILRFAD
ncbi:hypothetical protein C0992_000031 [Termitomyces sp. T32_za158]|nr:hypothetical protein C0992_000031 [Termitomyces sp. T32_za158]